MLLGFRPRGHEHSSVLTELGQMLAGIPLATPQTHQNLFRPLAATLLTRPWRLLSSAAKAEVELGRGSSIHTSDPATRDHCIQAGAKLLVAPEKAEKGLREGLRKLGYVFPAG